MMINRNEVISMVREILGDNIEGLFVDCRVMCYDSAEDYEIMSNLKENFAISLYDWDNFKVAVGATKLVIIPEYRNYVIKVPFTGTYAVKRRSENGTFLPIEDREYYYNGGVSEDVIEKENRLYDESSSELQQVLKYNSFIGWVDKVPVYVQEKVDLTCEEAEDREIEIDKFNDVDYKIAKYIRGRVYSSLTTEFLCNLVKHYGIKKTKYMLDEMIEMNDLHVANCGYDKYGKCAIFDTAGYEITMWEGSYDPQYGDS